jgi:hypothetical protein
MGTLSQKIFFEKIFDLEMTLDDLDLTLIYFLAQFEACLKQESKILKRYDLGSATLDVFFL